MPRHPIEDVPAAIEVPGAEAGPSLEELVLGSYVDTYSRIQLLAARKREYRPDAADAALRTQVDAFIAARLDSLEAVSTAGTAPDLNGPSDAWIKRLNAALLDAAINRIVAGHQAKLSFLLGGKSVQVRALPGGRLHVGNSPNGHGAYYHEPQPTDMVEGVYAQIDKGISTMGLQRPEGSYWLVDMFDDNGNLAVALSIK